jgi:hypothetical protein
MHERELPKWGHLVHIAGNGSRVLIPVRDAQVAVSPSDHVGRNLGNGDVEAFYIDDFHMEHLFL